VGKSSVITNCFSFGEESNYIFSLGMMASRRLQCARYGRFDGCLQPPRVLGVGVVCGRGRCSYRRRGTAVGWRVDRSSGPSRRGTSVSSGATKRISTKRCLRRCCRGPAACGQDGSSFALMGGWVRQPHGSKARLAQLSWLHSSTYPELITVRSRKGTEKKVKNRCNYLRR
jgi:hypothetical protein